MNVVINDTYNHIRTLNTSYKNILGCPIQNISHAITAWSRNPFHISIHRAPSWWRSSERLPLGRVSIRIQNQNSHLSIIDRSSTNYLLNDYNWRTVHLKRRKFRETNLWHRSLCPMSESIIIIIIIVIVVIAVVVIIIIIIIILTSIFFQD